MADSSADVQAKTLAIIESRRAAFDRSPFWFTAWDLSANLLKIAFWICFWALIAECTCNGCIWDAKP